MSQEHNPLIDSKAVHKLVEDCRSEMKFRCKVNYNDADHMLNFYSPCCTIHLNLINIFNYHDHCEVALHSAILSAFNTLQEANPTFKEPANDT